MATMNVSLPEPMKDWVEAQAKTGRYSDASDYVCDLIRRDQERGNGLAELQAAVDAGMASGMSSRTPADIKRMGRDMAAAFRQA